MLTTAVPFEEAAAFLQGKPAVSRGIFDQLLPELRARAFVITGVDRMDAVQAARDAIAEIQRGADWAQTKKALSAKLAPWLGEGAEIRTEMLMRWHGYQAYAVANKRNLDANTDLFPYRQYQSAQDSRVRASHAALNGLVLPADSKFWDRHTPPWEYGCRCDVRGVTAEEADEIRAEDARKPEEKRRILEGPTKEKLEQFGRLEKGINEIYDVRTPSERGESGVEWGSKDLVIPIDALESRYDPDLWARFRTWAEATRIEGLGTVWEWMGGQAKVAAASNAAPVITSAAEARAALDVLRADYDEAEREIAALVPMGRAQFDQYEFLRAQIPGLPEAYAKKAAVINKARETLAIDHQATRPFEPSTKVRKGRKELVAKHAEALDLWAKMIGPQALEEMAKVRPLKLARINGRAYYDMHGTVHLDVHSTVSTHMHEIAHWMEHCSPTLLKRSADFLERRTAGDKITYYHGRRSEPVKEDDFWSNYCGKQYKDGSGDFYATEILSMGIERYTFDPFTFAADDADYFDFIYTTLRKPIV